MTIEPAPDTTAEPAPDTIPTAAERDAKREAEYAAKLEGVWMRIPRRVEWKVWRLLSSGDGQPTLVVPVKSGFMVVVDNACTYRFIEFRRSLWAKRSITVDFSESGMLTGFASTSESTLSAIATAGSDSAQAVGDGLTAAVGIRTSIGSLQSDSAARKLADLTRQADTREQELRLAGEKATTTDYAELERLKQRQAIAEAQAAIDPAALATASLNRDTALATAEQDATQTIRDLRAQLTLEQLKSDIAKAQS